MKETLQPNVEKKAVMIKQSVLCPPRSGTILAVKMPCGRKALACVLRNIYPTAWCGNGPSKAIALRVKWLPAQYEYIRGYKIVWGEVLSSPIEGTLPWPPNPFDTCYGTRQLGEYRVIVTNITGHCVNISHRSTHFSEFARMEAWCEEARKMDVTKFSSRMQQVIKEYEATAAAQRRASETDLDYLRRTRSDLTDDACVCYLLWSIVAGKSIRNGDVQP